MSSVEKRYSRWYERLLLSTGVISLLTIFITVLAPAFLLWEEDIFVGKERINTIIMLSIFLILLNITLHMLMKFPGEKRGAFIFSGIASLYSLLFVVLFLFKITYSQELILINVPLIILCSLIGYFFLKRLYIPKIALIPLGRAKNLENRINNVKWIVLDKPEQLNKRINSLVTDLHSMSLTSEWQYFIAQCALNNIPVYNVRQLEESLTGRVRITHMYENNLGSLLPSSIYSSIKRLIDTVLILFTAPITLPIMLVTAIAIRLESDGNVLFTQKRIGQGGKEFKIYKFRSMCKDSEKNGAQFASNSDMRVTKIGKFIRKTRIDELPQFFNVLKGDMSLIGPRPEQKAFVEKFEQEIPFYSYRHIVKPGISGWAQVMHGYAADVNDTKVKLEFDFYYIKNFSLWLDILIIFKTLRTMLTGFGAR